MTNGIHIFDNVLTDPRSYRAEAFNREYRSYDFGTAVFHGIAVCANAELPQKFLPGLTGKTTFLRRSPHGQQDPNYIHTDIGMGEWTGILYLNPQPPPEDGTIFWTHVPSGKDRATPEDDMEGEWGRMESWDAYHRVEARFNRLLLFDSALFHSRVLFNNYGHGTEARLVQVFFGSGKV